MAVRTGRCPGPVRFRAAHRARGDGSDRGGGLCRDREPERAAADRFRLGRSAARGRGRPPPRTRHRARDPLAASQDAQRPAQPPGRGAAETVVIAAAAYAATGNPNALLLIGSAWAGALLGDVAAHHLGRGIGPVTRWLRRRKLSGPLVQRAERELRNRGGMLILSARFIPGGRTATNVASGMIAYPRGRFIGFAAIAALLWSIYTVGIGMLGGLAFHDQPLLGVGLGIGIALAVGG